MIATAKTKVFIYLIISNYIIQVFPQDDNVLQAEGAKTTAKPTTHKQTTGKPTTGKPGAHVSPTPKHKPEEMAVVGEDGGESKPESKSESKPDSKHDSKSSGSDELPDASSPTGDTKEEAKREGTYSKKETFSMKASYKVEKKGGYKGDGNDGNDGSDGSDGRDGRDGRDGKDGKDGRNNRDGKNGRDGKDGRDRDGRDGRNGRDGRDGSDGNNGNNKPSGRGGNTRNSDNNGVSSVGGGGGCGGGRRGGLTVMEKILDPMLIAVYPAFTEMGFPDSVVTMTKFCVEWIPIGIAFLAATNVRWPFKLLMRAVIFCGAIGMVTWNLKTCINPISIGEYVTMGNVANKYVKELNEVSQELIRRYVNMVDGGMSRDIIQPHSCCAWFDFKNKLISVAPEVSAFIREIFEATFKIPETIYCFQYRDHNYKESCKDVEFMDHEPCRMVPKHFVTACLEILATFI